MISINGLILSLFFLSIIVFPNQQEKRRFVNIDNPMVIKAPKAQNAVTETSVSSLPIKTELTLEPLVINSQDVAFTSDKIELDEAASQKQKSIFIASASKPVLTSAGYKTTINENYNLVGPIEISGGLAVTEKNHIEIRRIHVGIAKELGIVDLHSGEYKINVDEFSGIVAAHLLNDSGVVLGEGIIFLNNLKPSDKRTSGPKIEIRPAPQFNISYNDAYKRKTSQKQIYQEPAQKGSTTLVKGQDDDHLPTNVLATTTIEEQSAPLFPTSMIKAFYELTTSQRLTDSELSRLRLVWGKVKLDNQPIAGISVEIETQPWARAIYFNELMIPDVHLKTTSSNGIFVFLDVDDGYHSLLAKRGSSFFGFNNIIIEPGAVSYTEITTSIKKNTLEINTFDAFSGQPVETNVSLQSLPNTFLAERGQARIYVPQQNTVGQGVCSPITDEYLSAKYFYSESFDHANFPLIKKQWLEKIKNLAKINVIPGHGLIVGFSPTEDYKVYWQEPLDKNDPAQILYFDYQGNLTNTNEGAAGGGFIIFNIKPQTTEIAILNKVSQKIFSQVVPVTSNSLTILTK